MHERRYTDDEVHAIFQRAAVRQEEARTAEDASRAGLTLDELQEIGRASGIDPAHVAEAALEVRGIASARPSAPPAFLGMPTEVRAERYLPLAVTDGAWEQIVPELRRLFGTDGLSGQIGRVREWTMAPSPSSYDRPAKVTVIPEGEGARVRIEQAMKSQAQGLAAGSATFGVVAGVIGTLALLGDFEGGIGWVALLFAVIALVFFGASWGGLRAYARRRAETFEQALDRIEILTRDAASDGRHHEAPAPFPEARPRLDLDALPDAPEAETRPRSSERTRS